MATTPRPRGRQRKTTALDVKRQTQALGLSGVMTAQARDVFSNLAARTGFGSSSLENGAEYPLTRFTNQFWSLISLYESSWIARRVVDAPAADMLKTWPRIISDTSPEDLGKVSKAIRKTNTKGSFLEGLTWGRLFGGAGGLIVVKGHEHELDQPLDLDDVPLGGYQGISIFDRWSGIQPSGEVCEDAERPLDVGLPEYYTVTPQGGSGFRVHASRIIRFCGPMMPEPENSVYSGWGISVLAPVLQSMNSYENLSANALSLSFRANLIGMKEDGLSQLLSGASMNQKSAEGFANRMAALNQSMSNQSLIIYGKDGELSNIQYSFSGLSELIQMFQLQLAGAAEMPPSLLWGRLYGGIGGDSGSGDEKQYEKSIATKAQVFVRPQLEKLLPVICMSELGEVPDDMELDFPSIRVLDEHEKAELAKAVVDTVTVALNSGGISKRTYAKELKASSEKTGIFTNITDEFIESLPDTVADESEMGEGLFEGTGEQGGTPEALQLNPSSSPAKVLHESDKRQKEEAESKGKAEDVAGHVTSSSRHPGESKHDFTTRLRRVDEWERKIRSILSKPRGAWTKRDFDEVEELASLLEYDESDKTWQAYDADLRQGVTKCAWCGAKLSGDDVAEVGRAVVCPDCADAYQRGKATDEDGPAVGKPLNIHGLTVVIETPKGHVRSGEGWATVMPADYGFIKGYIGADGDSVDCYVGPDASSDWAYVVDQRNLTDGKFDEVKCMLGFPTAHTALQTYRNGHHRSAEVFQDWTPMHIAEFKDWLKTHDHKLPCGVVSN